MHMFVFDKFFDWLINNFLQYFSRWKQSIENRPGQFTPLDKSKMFISWQRHESLQITCFSIIDLIKFLLNNIVQYVFTERFCQDPLENYFIGIYIAKIIRLCTYLLIQKKKEGEERRNNISRLFGPCFVFSKPPIS